MKNLEKLTNATIVAAALIAVGVLVKNQITPPAPAQESSVRREKVDGWADVRESVTTVVESPQRLAMLNGMSFRPAGSQESTPLRAVAIDVVLVTDYECPFCKAADSTISALANKYGPLMVRSVLHFPLNGHRQALPAARALECARAEGVESRMNATLFARQDSLGVMSWGRLAEEAAVEDTVAFKRCIESTEHDAHINAGKDLARRLRIGGTPALILNGELIYPASPETIQGALDSLISRRSRR